MKKLFFYFLLLALCSMLFANPLSAQPVELIDIPTAEVVDANHYSANFRLYQDGGILSRIIFGLGKRVNLGVSFDLVNFIGKKDVDFQRPELQLKFRFYDGSKNLPAFALGYDSQGYYYDSTTEKYRYPEKGVYLVASREIFSSTEFHLGLNIYDFKTDQFCSFLGFSWTAAEEVIIFTEVDRIWKLDEKPYINLGLRYLHTPNLSVEVSARNLTQAKDTTGTKQEWERIMRINYQGKF